MKRPHIISIKVFNKNMFCVNYKYIILYKTSNIIYSGALIVKIRVHKIRGPHFSENFYQDPFTGGCLKVSLRFGFIWFL